MTSLLAVLSLLFAFIYWVFGGVIFSIIALLGVGRIRRVRFGCLFSFSALGLGALAAWSGLQLSRPRLPSCELSVETVDRWHRWLERFSCGSVEIGGAFVIGFLLLLVLGAVFLALSRSSREAWIEKGQKEEETHKTK